MVADYLSSLSHSTTDIPHWQKCPYTPADPADLKPINISFTNNAISNIQHPPAAKSSPETTNTVLLLYNDSHIDLHLDHTAGEATKDQTIKAWWISSGQVNQCPTHL